MQRKNRRAADNLLDYLSSLDEGQCYAFPYQCLVQVADRLELPPSRHKDTRKRSKAIINSTEQLLAAQGYWVERLAYDAHTEAGRDYCTALGRTMRKVQEQSAVEFTPEQCESMLCRTGRKLAGFVIGRGSSSWPAAELLMSIAQQKRVALLRHDRKNLLTQLGALE